MARKRRRMKKAFVVFILLVAISLIGIGAFLYFDNEEKMKIRKINEEKKLVEKIKNSYNKYVKIKSGSTLYKLDNGKYSDVLKLTSEKEFTLEDAKIDKDTKYFLVKELGYYVRYQDVLKIDSLASKDMRYKNYLPFNLNVVTKNKVSLYQDDKVIYQLN